MIEPNVLLLKHHEEMDDMERIRSCIPNLEKPHHFEMIPGSLE